MKNILAKTGMALALGATTLASAAPAQAQDYRHRSHRGGDATGAAIIAGIAGLAIGAAVASSSHHDRDYDRRYEGYDRYDGQRYYQGYRPDAYSYRDGYAYRGYDDGYRGYARDCTVERRWDRYSGRQVTVRVCR